MRTTAESYCDVVALIRAGRSIDAIKLARERFGLGLKEAKDLIEAIVAQHYDWQKEYMQTHKAHGA